MLTTSDVPHLKGAAVPEAKKAVKAEPKPKLARAAESGDPAVQWLLAERLTHVSVGDDAKVAEMDRRLAELGFTVH